MPGSSTTPGRSDLAMVRPKRVAFRTRNGVGTRGLAFAAQWLAYALPYRGTKLSISMVWVLSISMASSSASYTMRYWPLATS
jgi:hypothetical protein